jgi:chemotaxis protein methyltransferase CheR
VADTPIESLRKRPVVTTVIPPAILPGQVVINDREFQRFRALVAQQTGIALSETKRQLVCSRLGKRLRHYGYETFSEYYEHLMEADPDGEELVRMINAITTNKTEFFREAHHFGYLRSQILPRLAAQAETRRRLRVWSAGCSSGEEPYSIALTVLDALPGAKSWDVRILASDIDTDMLAQAEEGIYPEDRLQPVPRELLDRYFARGRGQHEGLMRVRREAREMLTFRRINLRDETWPIRTSFDCIFCRNVIIYFDRALQQRLVARLVRCLNPGGYLFLGHSESLLGMQAGLRYLGQTVYQNSDVGREAGASRG